MLILCPSKTSFMDIEEVREYCINKPGVTEGFPFDETTLVFKVMNKMFALLDLTRKYDLGLKCDPERATELREHYESVKPGYHLNKKLWNNVFLDGDVDDELILELIDHSYELIVRSLTKKAREELKRAADTSTNPNT